MTASTTLVWICIVAFFGASSAMPIEMMEAFEVYRNTCIDLSGSDQGYEQVMMSIQPMKVCVTNNVNFEQLSADMRNAPGGNWKAAYLSYCPKFNKTVPCFDNIVDGVTKCIGQDEEQYKTVFRNVFYNIIGLLCEEELRIFTESRRPEFKTCSGQLRQFAVECGASNITRSGSLNSFTEGNCQDFEKSRECIKTKVDECGAPFIMELFDAFYKAVMQGSSCNQFFKASEVTDINIKETES